MEDESVVAMGTVKRVEAILDECREEGLNSWNFQVHDSRAKLEKGHISL